MSARTIATETTKTKTAIGVAVASPMAGLTPSGVAYGGIHMENTRKTTSVIRTRVSVHECSGNTDSGHLHAQEVCPLPGSAGVGGCLDVTPVLGVTLPDVHGTISGYDLGLEALVLRGRPSTRSALPHSIRHRSRA
jgi:hypothetical protein